MKRRIKKGLFLAVRDTHFVSRLIDELKRREKGVNFDPTSSLFVIDTGTQTTYSGSGSALNDFEKNSKISYSGQGTEVANFFQYHFDEAEVRFLKFDESFHTAPRKDCRSSKNTYMYDIFMHTIHVHNTDCIFIISYYSSV